MDYLDEDFSSMENVGNAAILQDREFVEDSGPFHYAEETTEYAELHSLLADGGDRYGVSAVSFDLQEELLWIGNQGGHLTSYYGPEMQKYTSFQVHQTNEVCQIHSTVNGILALMRNSLRCQSRQGIPIFNHCTESLEDMQCMLLTSPTSLLMGGHQDKLITLDLTRVEEIQQVDIEHSGCAILREHSKYICSGDTSGKVTLRDPRSLRVEHALEAHTGTLSDFDVSGNHLVTCGFSNRKGNLSIDRFLMVYDLRMLRAVAPIQILLDPLLLRFVPAFTSQFAVVSQTGQFQLVETGSMTQSSMRIGHVNTGGAMCLTFDVSSSCKAMAFGDAGGGVHLFALGNQTGQLFNRYSQATEFAEPMETAHHVDINDVLYPLASVPMPYSSGKLLSDWSPALCKVVYRRPKPIDTKILQTMKMVQSIGYAPNPGQQLRNQVPYKLTAKHSRKRLESRDLSKGGEDSCVIVPKRYQKIETKYSKTGADEFDYNFYNRSSFSGLESTSPHSYCNAMLQGLYFIEPLCASLLSHLCDKEFCLSCELGFLFHMFNTSKGIPCQANNFFRAFRTIPEASALGLILNSSDDGHKKANLCLLIQNWNRFILQQIHADTVEPVKDENEPPKTDPNPKSAVSNLFGAKMYNENKCKCGQQQKIDAVISVFSLVYPDIVSAGFDKPCARYTFADVLKRSLCLEQTTQAWCDQCERYQPTVQSRRFKELPDMFAINCGMDTNQDINFWKIQTEMLQPKSDVAISSTNPILAHQKPCRYGTLCTKKDCKFLHNISESIKEEKLINAFPVPWLPPGFRVKLLDDGKVHLRNCTDSKQDEETSSDDNSIEYELVMVVNHVRDPRKAEHQNLVSFIKVGPSYHIKTMGGKVTQWYIFNDFVVVPVLLDEVLSFDPEWKLPCVLYYARKDLDKRHTCQVVSPITQDVFLEDKSLATRGGNRRITFTPLGIDEMLSSEDVIAMDAEFVSLNQEESELRSDGTWSTIKPSQMAVARITCVRCQGPTKGTPFIDDYISTQEQVVDYLTKFSGIMPGDLDASLSSKHLTTLKSTYVKLRYLIDNGIKFVGHGLKTDFRVINLVVPPEQVIDTVYLFHQPHQRMISLRFLAWHFLGLKIQSVIHDSIEDSRTALKLYEQYEQLEREGKVKEVLKHLYETGRNMQWKVPGMKG